MKRIVLLGCMLTLALSCKAQAVIPVEKVIDFIKANKGIPAGIYLKDVNNLFGKYVGTWQGSYNNRNYTFFVVKYTDNSRHIEDEIEIRYVITNPNGSVVMDTRNEPDAGEYVISGDYFSKDASYYVMIYGGRESKCGQFGSIYVSVKNSSDRVMSLMLVPGKFFIDEKDCPGLKTAEQLMPVEGMLLSKQ
jgi:hypothetical protein